MKNFGYSLIFIFCSLCAIIGLLASKFYNTYIKKNILIQIFLYTIGFLLILKLGMVIIVPLVGSMIAGINPELFSSIFTNYLLPIFKSPVTVVLVVSAILVYLCKQEV